MYSTQDIAVIHAVWSKATAVPGYPGFATDQCGALIRWSEYGQQTQYGWEIDHVYPASQGGSDAISNLQPLHWRNNRAKGDIVGQWTCAVY